MPAPILSNKEDARAVADWLHAEGYGCATQEDQDWFQDLGRQLAEANDIEPAGADRNG